MSNPVSSSLPTLPFEVLRQLLESMPLSTDDGVLLRRTALDQGALHLLLSCLAIFTHQPCATQPPLSNPVCCKHFVVSLETSRGRRCSFIIKYCSITILDKWKKGLSCPNFTWLNKQRLFHFIQCFFWAPVGTIYNSLHTLKK